MRYMVDKRQTQRIELPPEDGSQEKAWVEFVPLSAADYVVVEQKCQKLGLGLQTLTGMTLLAERVIRGWSFPLPVDPGHIHESFNSLTVEVITYIADKITEDEPLSEEARQDLPNEPPKPTSQPEAAEEETSPGSTP